METAGKHRITFVTVGQSPRDDIMPDILTAMRCDAEVTQIGALDGLDDRQIMALAPENGERRLCTRLRDGREVITSKRQTALRLNAIFTGMAQQDSNITVLLCTGYFDDIECGGLFIESQRLVDSFVSAVAYGGRSVGVMVPLAAQTGEAAAPVGYQRSRIVHASPYSGDRLREAGRELADVDLIVMHCMGYSEQMRQTVVDITKKPVILARRVVAAGLDQLI